MVRTADIDQRQTVGAVEQLIRHAAVGNRFPDDDGLDVVVSVGYLSLASLEKLRHDLTAAQRAADEMDDARLQQRAGEIAGCETLLLGRVLEGAPLRGIDVAVPASSR